MNIASVWSGIIEKKKQNSSGYQKSFGYQKQYTKVAKIWSKKII